MAKDPQLPLEARAFANEFASAKAVEFSAAFTGTTVTLHLRCSCQHELHAGRVASTGEAVWDKSLKGVAGMARLAPLKKAVRGAFKEIIDNGIFGKDGPKAEMNAKISVPSAVILLKDRQIIESEFRSAFGFGD